MKIILDITNCTDKKALVYGLAESGIPVCFVENEIRLRDTRSKVIIDLSEVNLETE